MIIALLDPEREPARQLLLDELARPEYAAAQPTWWDMLMMAIGQFIMSFLAGITPGDTTWLTVVIIVVVAVLIIIGLLIWGLPRSRRRLYEPPTSLFDADDRRSVEELRRDADAHERAGRFSEAVLDRFRALARALDDRTAIVLQPGTTAPAIGRRAAEAFPAEAANLHMAANLFDRVRYLDASATAVDARALAALDERIQNSSPVLLSGALS